MEIAEENTFLWNQDVIYFSGILRIAAIAVLLTFLSYFTWQRRKFVAKFNNLPSNKCNFYNVFGDSQHALRIRRMKTSLSPHIYDLIIINSYSIIFQKESLFNIWGAFWPIVIVHKADAAEAILNSSSNLKKSWIYKFVETWLGDGLLISHDGKWKNRRKLLTPAFHFNILKIFLPVINKQSRILVDILNRHTSEEFIDIKPYLMRCALDIVCESALGTEIHTQTDPNNPYAKSVSILSNAISERIFNPLLWSNFIFKFTPVGRKFFHHLKIVHDFTTNFIHRRKEAILNSKTPLDMENTDEIIHKKKSFLDLLLDEHIKHNSISEEEIRKEVDTFTFGGHDTSATALSSIIYLIGLHPGIQEKIHQELDSIFGTSDRDVSMDDLREMKYLECVIKESLRLYPPASLFGREIEQDIKFKDYIIPAGCNVFVSAYMLHRDPEVFPNPEKFDPDRFTPENTLNRHAFAYIPFSAGPRNCIGQRFAFMELKTVISFILRNFRVRSLDARDKIHFASEIILRPVESLRLEIRKRNHLPKNEEAYIYYP